MKDSTRRKLAAEPEIVGFINARLDTWAQIDPGGPALKRVITDAADAYAMVR